MTRRHLLVIGGQRCGTTYLHGLLDAHPQITMARPARPEPKVFLSVEATSKGLEWYESRYFAHANGELLLGEKSTSYIEHPEAASRAAKVLGEPEILVLLRDPIDRAVSNWQFSVANGLEVRPLQEALSANLEGPRAWGGLNISVSPYAYLERGRYADYLTPWCDHFANTMHICFFEELIGDHEQVSVLYDALNVDSKFSFDSLEHRVNESEEHPPALSDELLRRLREYFADSDAALRRRLGRALPWAR